MIGDKPIASITRHDMLDFREFWMDRIEADEIDPGTANKDLTHVGDVLREVKERLINGFGCAEITV